MAALLPNSRTRRLLLLLLLEQNWQQWKEEDRGLQPSDVLMKYALDSESVWVNFKIWRQNISNFTLWNT
jgi:hypothetical protein